MMRLPSLPATIVTMDGYRIYPPLTKAKVWIVRKDGVNVGTGHCMSAAMIIVRTHRKVSQ